LGGALLTAQEFLSKNLFDYLETGETIVFHRTLILFPETRSTKSAGTLKN